MRTRTGTGIVIALFLALSLLCCISAVAQDNLQVTTTTNNKTGGVCSTAPTTNTTQALCTTAGGTWSTTNPTVNCAAYALDGVTCIAGQYYHSDAVKPSATWAGSATATAFGPWVEGVTGSSSGCLSCHHGSITTAGRGGSYLVGGHKNILRKVVAGQTLLDNQGVAVANVIDHSSNPYTLSQTAGTISGAAGTFTANYLAGWVADGAIDVFGTNTNGTANTTLAYGSCARCHTTGYRWDGKAPEPTSVSGTTYTKLPAAFNYPAGQKSGDTTVATSWSLTGIQCERCHKADMQYDATAASIANANIGTTAAPLNPAGRISHFNNIIPTSVTADATTGKIAGTDFYMSTAVTGTSGTRPLPNPPYALTCVECHQAYSTWTSKVAGTPGQVHLTPLPGFESLAPKASGNYSTTKDATGQFSATFSCVGATPAVTTATPNYYNACIANGGTVTYVPGGMSHGAVATILNSPHARVTGYVDIKTQNSADTTLAITGGTINDSTSLVNGQTFAGQYNTFFASAGTADQGAPAGVTTATNGVSGSCAGCHDIHSYLPNYFNPVVNATNVDSTPIKNCTTCHASHGKSMNHPTGPGTPYSTTIAGVNPTTSMGVGGQESCNICHFSKKTGTEYHFLRINPDPAYNTFPSAQQYYTTAGSGNFGKLNTYAETFTNPVTYQSGTYPAVGLDVDIACGQCHTGGDGTKNPYGLTAYAGDGGVTPRPYSRAFLAAAAANMHGTAANVPTITPALPATGGPTTITIKTSDISEGAYAGIFYTTDGTLPNVTLVGETYTAGGTTILNTTGSVSIPVTSTTTVYALAGGPMSYAFSLSNVVGGTYGVLPAPTATIAPTGAAISYPATVSVKLTDLAGNVCYTTNGTTPALVSGVCNGTTVASGTSITVANSEVIKAVGYGTGYGVSANVATATFTVTPPTPAFSNVNAKYPGTYVGAVTAILTDADVKASICYTTNGTTPALVSGVCNGTTVASGAPITVSATETIKAIAVDGTAVSKATSGSFVIH